MPNEEHKDISLERIIFFSDAVFAIAITILVLEIRLPEDAGQLGPLLPELLRQVLAYVFGFLQIAIFWNVHHTFFRQLVHYDVRLIWLNFAFLMIIAFLPVPVSTIIRLGITSSSITFMYACLALLGVVEWVIWRYISAGHRELVHPGLSPVMKKAEDRKIIYVIVIFFLGIGLAWINAYLAVAISLVIPFIHRRIEGKGAGGTQELVAVE